MSESKRSVINELRQLNLSLRAQLEQAEARVPVINALVAQLAEIELVTEVAILGLVIYQGHYSALTGPHDSGPVLQSALLIPGGIGVIYWDSEEYAALRKNPHRNEWDLFLRFSHFDDCPSAVKALLLPQVQSLMEQLLSRFRFFWKDGE
ncbi:MAG: hypothetical protein JWP89_3379 [Schlesneria sp.]|nr:hypothetical protein [Schlesneria sp.]